MIELRPSAAPRAPQAPPRRLLITGGAGFIGSHLARAWVAAGGTVTVLDDLSQGARQRLEALDPARAEFHEGSVLDAALVRRLVSDADAVAHLAAVVGVGRVSREPRRTLAVNGAGSRIVLEAAAVRGLRVLMTSSSEVYGAPLMPPFQEAAGPALTASSHPRAGYAISKAYAERLALQLAEHAGLELTIVRLFNTTGPGQGAASGMVLPRLVDRAARSKPLIVHGDGRQTRCFSHVEDVAAILLRLLQRCGRGEVFNVGSDREVAVGEVAQRIDALAGGVGIEHLDPSREFGSGFFDPRRRAPNLDALRAALGELPGRTWESIVDETYARAIEGREASLERPLPLETRAKAL